MNHASNQIAPLFLWMAFGTNDPTKEQNVLQNLYMYPETKTNQKDLKPLVQSENVVKL